MITYITVDFADIIIVVGTNCYDCHSRTPLYVTGVLHKKVNASNRGSSSYHDDSSKTTLYKFCFFAFSVFNTILIDMRFIPSLLFIFMHLCYIILFY